MAPSPYGPGSSIACTSILEQMLWASRCELAGQQLWQKQAQCLNSSKVPAGGPLLRSSAPSERTLLCYMLSYFPEHHITTQAPICPPDLDFPFSYLASFLNRTLLHVHHHRICSSLFPPTFQKKKKTSFSLYSLYSPFSRSVQIQELLGLPSRGAA